jgi:hypothetical protein
VKCLQRDADDLPADQRGQRGDGIVDQDIQLAVGIRAVEARAAAQAAREPEGHRVGDAVAVAVGGIEFQGLFVIVQRKDRAADPVSARGEGNRQRHAAVGHRQYVFGEPERRCAGRRRLVRRAGALPLDPAGPRQQQP